MAKIEGTEKCFAAHLAASLSMLLVILAMLLTSFQLAIYGDPDYRFYEKEYQKYQVTESLHMSLEDVMKVTDYMMDYLIGREEELSIVTEVDGRTQDFFNDQDRFHMGEVRELFLGGLRLRNICVVIALLLLLGLIVMKADWKRLLPKAYLRAVLVLLIVSVFLAVAFTVNFTQCFTIFHEIFFDNDLWMFNPSEDYMIRMLPEGFFSDMVVRIGTMFLGMVTVLGVIFIIWRKDIHLILHKNMLQ
ncbi:TIGR01906 family membrane protein [Sporofaciens musculi]|jgi:integral membrane protein (TIGR01906 family)|nr:TIGR01906 family membrane protein [Sporofaciens musculi]